MAFHRWALLALPIVVACGAAKAPEDNAPVSDSDLGGRAEHGSFTFGDTVTKHITAIDSVHAWSFELSAPSTIRAAINEDRTDTVVYLFDRTGASIARSDDLALDRELPAGRYRVVVKGYGNATRGEFALTVDCDGVGCSPHGDGRGQRRAESIGSAPTASI